MRALTLLCVAILPVLCSTSFLTQAKVRADEPAVSSDPVKIRPSDDAVQADETEEQEKKEPDPYVLPGEDDPAKLIEFIRTLQQLRSHVLEETHKMDTKQPEAIIAAADRILTADATDEQSLFAVKAKANALRDYHSDPMSEEKLIEFIDQMKHDKRPAIANYAYTFSVLRAVGNWSDLDAEKRRAFFADVPHVFASDRLEQKHYGMASVIGKMLERKGDTKAAIKFFNEIGPLFKASSNQKLARLGVKFDAAARRLNLPGKEMVITGQLLDGSTFDWKAYRGKVVLVDFWATWCGPCVAEIPNVLMEYERYHDKGFEVVGISLDSNKTKVEDFVEQRDIPWPILYSDEPNGWESPMAVHYGILSIPTPILVNQEGKVVSMTAQGEVLREELEKLLGKVDSPAESEKEAADPEKNRETKADSRVRSDVDRIAPR